VDAYHGRNSTTGGVSTGTSNTTGSSSELAMSLVYAGSPCKATAIEAAGDPMAEHVFVSAVKLAASSTRPLIETQQALAAAAAAAQQQQQQWQLPLLWPGKQLQQTVAQLAEQPLRTLFTQQGQQQQQTGSSGSSDKESRAAALAAIQAEMLRDLQRTGVLPEAGQSAVAAAGQVLREDALRAFDALQSKVMREVLLGSEVSHELASFSLCLVGVG
jgi:polyribonucleotide nucleotidyltransferase